MEKIAIIIGGNNSERSVSLRSGKQVQETLEKMDYATELFDIPEDFQKFLTVAKTFSFAFVMIHGKDGEDGKIPALLELLGIPFQGSPSIAQAIAIQKDKTKQIWRDLGLPVGADHLEIFYDKTYEAADALLQRTGGYPCVIKSLQEGSTRGVFIVRNRLELREKYEQIKLYQAPLLVEEYLKGDEYTVSILEMPDGETKALAPILIIPPTGEEFDYNNKYNGKTQEICPAPIEPRFRKKLEKLSLDAHKAVGARGYSRVDLICAGNYPYLLEINTIPGFTAQSLFPKAAEVEGISFAELLKILMATGKKIAEEAKNISMPL